MSMIFTIKDGNGVPLVVATSIDAVECYCKNRWATAAGYHDLADGILGDRTETLDELKPLECCWVYEGACYLVNDAKHLSEHDFVIQCFEAIDTFEDAGRLLAEGS